MTKRDLESRVKHLEETLLSRVVELEETLTAIGSRFLTHDGKRYVALPLTRDEDSAVRETIEDMVSRGFGNGRRLSGEYGCGESRWEDSFSNDDTYRTGTLLPQWDGYFVRYWYTGSDGISDVRIWGLKLVV